MEKKVRIQFDMPVSKARELDELIIATDVGTRTAYLNNALSLFKWAIRHRSEGQIIVAMDEENASYVELATPALDAVAKKEAVSA